MTDSRYIVGIDLGTTNSAVSYVDTEAGDAIRGAPVLQVTAAGEAARRDMLPSFCYCPAVHELPEHALDLPWSQTPAHTVGEFAREQGALVPGRMIGSAKSWLAHGGVDRTARILPWDGDLGKRAKSPVDVSRMFLDHIRCAWNHCFGSGRDREGTPCILEEQDVCLTVPASFDEAARELTVQAARTAGFREVVLLEEPLAAFYGWLAANQDSWRDQLQENELVLVIDIGGGTTDFSLIRIEEGYILRRTAVGDHLLLGGDNIDMALARRIEKQWGGKLAFREWSMLCHECRRAKERLLAPKAPDEVRIALAAAGARLVAGTRSAIVKRSDLVTVLMDGFFPSLDRDAPLPERGSGMRRMGLPYVSDPAVTRHLLAFLRRSATLEPEKARDGIVIPDRILFNGGTVIPQPIRERLVQAVGGWDPSGMAPAELTSAGFSLAVSRGAAYYGRVRRGEGVRVQGGIARSYYLAVGGVDGESKLLCVMPRDTEEGHVVSLDRHAFRVITNQPVRFPLFSSSTRLRDQAGDVIASLDDLTELPPLHTILTYGKGEVRQLDVHVAAELGTVGTLSVWIATRDGHHRYPLAFNLRAGDQGASLDERPEMVIDADRMEAAKTALRTVFDNPERLPHLIGGIEEAVALDRDQWGVNLLRALADQLLHNPDLRLRTADHEARWYNLAGFCMRPGFGAAGDQWRIKQLWKLWHAGPQSARKAQVAAEWWVCWRRAAGGLREGQQQQIGSVLLKALFAKGNRPLFNPKNTNSQEAREMWRCLGALERLPVKQKKRILRGILEHRPPLPPHLLWVVGRVGARHLFHGPENAILDAENFEPLLPLLLKHAEAVGSGDRRAAFFAVANTCRRCGVRSLDIGAEARREVLGFLEKHGADAHRLQQVNEPIVENAEDRREIIIDSLPLGLRLDLA